MSLPSALLLYCPITDPSAPYHSLVYVASYAKAHGADAITIRDLNIEAVLYTLSPNHLQKAKHAWETRRAALGRQSALDALEQIEYGYLTRALLLDENEVADAVATMRDWQRFANYPEYHRAVITIKLWLTAISCDGFPGQFDGGFDLLAPQMFSLGSVRDLTDEQVLSRVVGPFREYFERAFFAKTDFSRYEVIGLSVTYTSQLPYAIWLLRQLRSRLPKHTIILGGTEIGSIWKTGGWPLVTQLFSGANGLVVGEGERAFVDILSRVRPAAGLSNIDNVVNLAQDGPTTGPAIKHIALDELPPTDYSLMPLDGYLSPEPFVYYSPNRGCYWNKCTFCDYGINFGSPTAPWRQSKTSRIIRELKEISKRARFIYFSVDVLAPAATVELAKAIIDAGIDIRWAAELRLEPFFNHDRAALLKQSGCVALSVGFESGNQRILDLINKGTHTETIATIIGDLTRCGIAVQMMGFTGFPTETTSEALETVDFLKRHSPHWTVAGIGEFALTPGAIIAQNAERFSIHNLAHYEGDDIGRVLHYDEVSDARDESILSSKKKDLSTIDFDRPFAGGIDSPHSVMYYSLYGCDFPRRRWRDHSRVNLQGGLMPNFKFLEDEPYDVLSLANESAIAAVLAKGREAKQMLSHSQICHALHKFVKRRARLRRPLSPTIISNRGVILPAINELEIALRIVENNGSLRQALEYPEKLGLTQTQINSAADVIRAFGLAREAVGEIQPLARSSRTPASTSLSSSRRTSKHIVKTH